MGRKQTRKGRSPSWLDDYAEAQHAPPAILPRTEAQRLYLAALHQSDQIISIGPSGTGKTYLAAAVAAEKLIDREVEKIVLSRPAVGVDEEHGFLKGGLLDKIAPWLVPLTDALQDRLGQHFYPCLKTRRIEIVPLAFMRGRTFDNAFVLLDEAQNTSYEQIKMFLTRIGEDSTVVINGDVSQTDRLNARNGLAAIVDIVRAQELPVPIVEFTASDCVRSEICAMWAEAFEEYENAG